MTTVDKLVEQHILQHESHLRHIDELLERAEKGVSKVSEPSEINGKLKEVRQQREKLLSHIEELKRKTHEEWQEEKIEDVGPMVIWEAVAKQIEKLVERIEGSK